MSKKKLNWIEIDQILYRMFDAWDGVDEDNYLKSVQEKFKWTKRQAFIATRLIFAQRQKNNVTKIQQKPLKNSRKSRNHKSRDK